ncbi:MAG: DUF4263 domain-containing protein [Synergistaceae bacterium]|nr:DUF4263 domain-containing protein [Synergistaceae bacterium]
MIVSFDDSSSELRETTDGSIDLVSTSLRTADASPIILNSTERIRTTFVPMIIDNNIDQQKCVKGKLVHEKKRKKDTEFPTEKISRRSVKDGEVIEISLNTSETYKLFEGLKDLFDLHKEIGTTPLGSSTFARVDNSFQQLLAFISNDSSAASMLGQSENLELFKKLLQRITQTDFLESLKNGLKELNEANISSLSEAANITKLERALIVFDENMDNEKEEDWQNIFKGNQWILSQVFSCPYTIFEDKAYVGGKGLDNRNANICDFIYQNKLTQNIALIEIKTPCTKLLGAKYRGTYSLSPDMSGAVNQILNYKEKLTKVYYTVCQNTNKEFEVLSPKCFVIIGKLNDLSTDQIKTFENYRNNISNVTVITFDELKMRVSYLLQLFNSSDEPLISEIVDYDDDEIPF